jgi:hypothetical protein
MVTLVALFFITFTLCLFCIAAFLEHFYYAFTFYNHAWNSGETEWTKEKKRRRSHSVIFMCFTRR